MNLLRIFTRSPSNAGRELALHRVATERERIKAKARQLCAEIGKPVPGALQ